MRWLCALAFALLTGIGACGRAQRPLGAPRVATSPHQGPEVEEIISDSESLSLVSCPVHHRPLRLDLVKVEYGRIVPQADYAKAESDLFPNARTWFEGGCVDDGMAMARVHYCDLCRETRRRWLDQHADIGELGMRRLTGR